MIGLWFLVVYAICWWAIYGLAKLAAHVAGKHGGTPVFWRRFVWGLAALLVFWDTIPTIAYHRYLCSTYGGVEIDVPIEDLKRKYGLAETIAKPRILQISTSETGFADGIYLVNDRFVREIATKRLAFHIELMTYSIRDRRTDEKLASFSDVSSGSSSLLAYGPFDIDSYKKWLYIGSCGGEVRKSMPTYTHYFGSILHLGVVDHAE